MPSFNPYEIYRKLFRNPKIRPLVIGLTILYILSPIDLLPEFPLGVLGWIDDAILLPIFVSELVQWLFSKGRGRMTDGEAKSKANEKEEKK